MGRSVVTEPVMVHFLDPWNNMEFPIHRDSWVKELMCPAKQLRENRPRWVPVIMEKAEGTDIPEIDMKKYLVHGDTTLGAFVGFVRSRIRLRRKRPIFVYFKNTQPPTGATMSVIDAENTDEDGFLHMTYSGDEKPMRLNDDRRVISVAASPPKLQSSSPVENNPADQQPPMVALDNVVAASATSGSALPDTVMNKRRLKPSKRRRPRSSIGIDKIKVIFIEPWNSLEISRKRSRAGTLPAAMSVIPGSVRKKWWSTESLSSATQMRENYPLWVPVIVEKAEGTDIPDIDLKKYLVHGDSNLGDFVDFVRSMIPLRTKKPIFVYFKNAQPPTGATLSAIDAENKDEDGFLHVTYSGEETRMEL